MRMDVDSINTLKDEARLTGKTVSDYLQEQIINVKQNHILQEKIKDLEWQIQDLQKRTQTKVKKSHRISISITPQQYKTLQQVCRKQDLSKSEILRRFIDVIDTKKPIVPMLQ